MLQYVMGNRNAHRTVKRMEYQKTYGPSYRGVKADTSRCAAHVSGAGWGGSQCQRKATCDPNEDGKPTTCKQHSDSSMNARREKQRAAQETDMAKWQERYAAPRMRAALQKIADGHNDPRSLAQEVLAQFSK